MAAQPDRAARALSYDRTAPDFDDARRSGLQTSTGVYYQGELEFTDRFRVAGGIRGDIYHFDVKNRPENSGVESTGVVSPKLSVVFAPATRFELYGYFGYGYHSNDARGATIRIDPASGDPAERVTPLA